MEEWIGVISVVFMTVILPLVIIFHYVTKWKSTKGLTDEEQRMLEDLWEGHDHMMSRLDVLERILLDSDAAQTGSDRAADDLARKRNER